MSMEAGLFCYVFAIKYGCPSRPPFPALSGWVYVLANLAMPGLVKVGCTGRSPATRACELTASTGVPPPFLRRMGRAGRGSRHHGKARSCPRA